MMYVQTHLVSHDLVESGHDFRLSPPRWWRHGLSNILRLASTGKLKSVEVLEASHRIGNLEVDGDIPIHLGC